MRASITELVAKTAGMMVVFAAALFLPAGTFDWPAGWAFFALMFGFTFAMTVWLLRYNPDLLDERLGGIGRSDQKAWDKILLAVTAFAFFSWLPLMALDAVRFRWSEMPTWLQGFGAALLCTSFYVFYLTFRDNAYLSPAVRVQRDRGQTVVSTGLYRHVRHPMYAGFILFALGTAFLLGSWYGVLGALVLIGLVARRAVLEERVLREELEGYEAYMARVRYRFIPHIW